MCLWCLVLQWLLGRELCYLQGVFFFKQKTAYEMRISDWSSDVCSSDLSGTAAQADSNAAPARSPVRAEKREGFGWRLAGIKTVPDSMKSGFAPVDRKSVV